MSNIIFMAFSPRNILGCLLKKGLQRGGGGGGVRDLPSYTRKQPDIPFNVVAF